MLRASSAANRRRERAGLRDRFLLLLFLVRDRSGVRLAHRPTGVVVTATERRSQAQNRGEALARLRARLEVLARKPKPRHATKPTRGSRERRLAEKRRQGARKAERRTRE